MANRNNPHIHILPEDDRNREIVTGFLGNLVINTNQVKVLPNAYGWKKIAEDFKKNHIHGMRQYPKRIVVLLMDFDKSKDRLDYINDYIPDDLKDRVFVIGTQPNPEKLNAALNYKGFEHIGEILAQDCYNNTDELWGHEMLKHNKPELERMNPMIRDILFTQ